jgi:hypothetical protein
MKIEAVVAALTVTAVEMLKALVMGIATAYGDSDGGQNRVATNVSCNKEGSGDGGKSNGDEGGGQAAATATTWAMASAMRLAGNEEGKCKGSKFNSNGDEGGWRWRQPLKPFQRWQRPQQWLWRWQTTTETAGAGNNQQVGQVAAVEAVTAAVPAAIIAARLQWQVGARWSRSI